MQRLGVDLSCLSMLLPVSACERAQQSASSTETDAGSTAQQVVIDESRYIHRHGDRFEIRVGRLDAPVIQEIDAGSKRQNHYLNY